MAGAARLLPATGVLVLYGPYRREGRHTAASNEAFDRQLRATNPDWWGVRDLEAVTEAGSLSRPYAAERNDDAGQQSLRGIPARRMRSLRSHRPDHARRGRTCQVMVIRTRQ